MRRKREREKEREWEREREWETETERRRTKWCERALLISLLRWLFFWSLIRMLLWLQHWELRTSMKRRVQQRIPLESLCFIATKCVSNSFMNVNLLNFFRFFDKWNVFLMLLHNLKLCSWSSGLIITGFSLLVFLHCFCPREEEIGHKQVTWGHNIVADGWAGAANPHLHPTPFPAQTKSFKTLVFPLFH